MAGQHRPPRTSLLFCLVNSLSHGTKSSPGRKVSWCEEACAVLPYQDTTRHVFGCSNGDTTITASDGVCASASSIARPVLEVRVTEYDRADSTGKMRLLMSPLHSSDRARRYSLASMLPGRSLSYSEATEFDTSAISLICGAKTGAVKSS